MRLLVLTLAAIVCIAPIPSYAEVDKDLAKCAAIENPVSRLVCFDSLASERGAAPSTKITTSNGAGKWKTSTKIDPLTDKEIHFAALSADTGRGRFGGSPILVVRCQDNTTEMYINWNDFLGSGPVSTTYRVDKEPAQTSGWSLSTDKKAAFFPGSPVPTLKKIAESSSFVANVTPYNESPITAVFDTTGVTEAFTKIREGCSW